jgi:acyl carrier protein
MNDKDIQSRVIAIIQTIAPELEAGTLRVDQSLRKQVDLDSMDWLNLLDALHAKLAVEIPEADYEKLVTLDDLLAYLKRKVA